MGDTEKNAISILKHLITDERKKIEALSQINCRDKMCENIEDMEENQIILK